MVGPHPIRLHGPWECTPLEWLDGEAAVTPPLPPPGRLRMPGDWSAVCGENFRGRARLTRRFHWPSRLGTTESLWVVFEGIRGSARLWIDDHVLGEINESVEFVEFEITRLIRPESQLIVEIASTENTPVPGIHGEIRLEVRTR